MPTWNIKSNPSLNRIEQKEDEETETKNEPSDPNLLKFLDWLIDFNEAKEFYFNSSKPNISYPWW